MKEKQKIALVCLFFGMLSALVGLIALASKGIDYSFGNFLFFGGLAITSFAFYLNWKSE